MATSPPPPDAQHHTTTDLAPDAEPRLQLERGVEYDRMRGLIESSLFGESAEPLRIGRFTVLEQVGSGGMGVVYAAYDDVLDRKVAVKVLRGSASEEARERMLREARAMARLSHPNIVTVHEVGEHQEQVFLAMEFVRGRNLAEWIHEPGQPRPWREILSVFAQAGRGLAAAHEAGLVHRDFKPHNVVQGEGGTVKVLDFGLAFPTAPGDVARSEPGRGTREDDGDSQSLTRTGAIVGTPAYMAPEQLRAEPVTPASDQFAFCVSLFEALYQQRPFAGTRLEQLVASVLDGEIQEPPPGAVPAWVRAIVMRGLSASPAERFESLPMLLEALERDPAVARRRWLTGAVVAGLAVAGSFGLAALQKEESVTPCRGSTAALEPVWSEERRDSVREGFLASGVPYAEDAWSRLSPRLDAYASEWIDTSTEACQAHEEGRQSDAIFDLRTVCLASRRSSLDAVAALLVEADAGVVEHAVDVLAGLPPVARCSDLTALTATVPPPDDPDEARAVAEIREELAAARVQEDAGRFEDAIALALGARERARPLGYAPLQAEASLRVGSVRAQTASGEMLDQADEELAESLYQALGEGHHEVAIEALARRVYVRAELMRQPPERTHDDEPLVRALLRRDPGDARLRWLVANNFAVRSARAGELERAGDLYDEALREARSRDEDGRRDAAAVLANRALDELDRGELWDAETHGKAALAMAEPLLGPTHPQISLYLYPVATSLMVRGRHIEARALFERSVSIFEQMSPPSPDVAQDLYVLAQLSQVRREYGQVRSLVERGLAVVGLESFGSIRLLHARGDARIGRGEVEAGLADHRTAVEVATALLGRTPDAASSHHAMAEALLGVERVDDAATSLERAREIFLAASVPESSLLWVPDLRARARLHLARQQPERAVEVLERALEITRDGVTSKHPAVASLLRVLGEAHLQQGRLVEARDAHDAAVTLLEAEHDRDHPELADARTALARVLSRCVDERCDPDSGDPAAQRARAGALMDAAEQAYRMLGDAFASEQQAIGAWRERQVR